MPNIKDKTKKKEDTDESNNSLTEITVIQDKQKIDLASLQKEDFDTYFKELKRETKEQLAIAKRYNEISHSNFERFKELTAEQIDYDNRLVKPTIVELLLRKIIQLSYMFVKPQYEKTSDYPLVIPIVGDINNTKRAKGIKVRFDRLIKVSIPKWTKLYNKNKYSIFTIAKNHEFVVSGLMIFAPKVECNNIVKFPERLLIGNYTFYDLLLPNNYITNNYAKIPYESFLFDEKTLEKDLSVAYDYIANIYKYGKQKGNISYAYLQIENALNGSIDNRFVKDKLQKLFSIRDKKNHKKMQKQKFSKELMSIVEKISEFTNIVISDTFYDALITDIQINGLFDIYKSIKLHPSDEKNALYSLKSYRNKLANIEFQRKIMKEKAEILNKISEIKSIIEEKLPNKYSLVEEKIKRSPSLLSDPNNILNLLDKNEQKMIKNELESRESYLKAVLNNDCPHVEIYREFRTVKRESNIRRLFNKLKQFFDRDTKDDFIKCKRCKFNIMCPHVAEYIEADLHHEKFIKMKELLTKYISDGFSAKYSKDSSVRGSHYYCKICGEVISSYVRTDTTLADSNDELKRFMWGEIAYIVNKYVKFDSLVNTKKFITHVVDVCHPFMFITEKRILKSKTNSAEEIKAKKRLYTDIFAFAYLIHLASKRDLITFRDFKENESKTFLIGMIKYAIEAIMNSRNVIIKEIQGMNMDTIKSGIIDAYKNLTYKLDKKNILSATSDDISQLLLDPIYSYIRKIYKYYLFAKKSHNVQKLTNEKFIADYKEKTDHYLKFIQQYEQKYSLSKNSKFDDSKNLPIAKLMDSFYELYDGYVARSFELFAEKIKNKHYEKFIHIGIFDKKTDSFSSKKIPEIEKYDTTYNEFIQREQKLLFVKKFLTFRQKTSISIVNTRLFSNPIVSLGRLYDEDGRKHKWKFIDNDSKNELKCVICGVLRKDAEKLNENKIKKSLEHNLDIENFLRFYDSKCPEGKLHEIEKNKCKKCNKPIIEEINNEILKYYKKYSKLYNEEIKQLSQTEDITDEEPKPPLKTKEPTEYKNWVYNFNIILDLANKLKINHRLLSYLGAYEKQKLEEIESGTYIPLEAENKNDTRIYILDGYIKEIFSEYNKLQNYDKLIKPSAMISKIIDESNISKHVLSKSLKNLPDIIKDYYEVILYIKKTRKPRDIVNFLVQKFCEICLSIWLYKDKQTERLRHDFVRQITNKIINDELLVTKNNYFSWSIIYGEKGKKDDDLNTSVDDEEVRDDDDDDDITSFGNNFDMETNPGGDEDNDNDIKIGDEYGL